VFLYDTFALGQTVQFVITSKHMPVFDKFPKYHMKIVLGDFNAKVGREDIFKPTIGNKSLHEISAVNGVVLINFAKSKNLRVTSTMFLHHNVRKYTCTSPDEKTHNQIDHILVASRRLSNVFFFIVSMLSPSRFTSSALAKS
jgi:hypothetical protein